MKFKTLFMAHTPTADKDEHKSKIETEKYVLYVNLVRDQEEALETAEEYAEEKGVQSIILCPGFTNEEVGELSQSLDGVGINVARGDGPSGKIAKEVMQKAGWFE
ncbi:MAG: DUF6506 family protein [Thermoplasmata archaeon]